MKYLSHLAAALFHLAVVDAAKVFLKKKLGKVTSKSEASQEPQACSAWKQLLNDHGTDDADAWCVSSTRNTASEWNDAMADDVVPTAAQATGDPDPDAIECCTTTTPSPNDDDSTDDDSTEDDSTDDDDGPPQIETCLDWQSQGESCSADNQQFTEAANAGAIPQAVFADACCEDVYTCQEWAADSGPGLTCDDPDDEVSGDDNLIAAGAFQSTCCQAPQGQGK